MESTPTNRREYLPIVADLVSVGGLAPDEDTPVGSAVRLPDGRFSVARLADEYRVTRDPTSVRELTTPQTEGDPGVAIFEPWENWLGDFHQSGAKDFRITGSNEAQRSRLIQLVVQNIQEKFRAVGSGHSHSEAARPVEFYSDLKEVEGTLPQPWLRASDDPFWTTSSVSRDHLIRLQAGTVLKKLNRDILQQARLALPNMGSWDGQTLAGAINTSTHGTGLGLGTFADLVRSVEIVTVPESQYEADAPHVRLFRIEPTDGITDPRSFPMAAGEHDTVLIQDDDLFHSVVVGYGSFGIVYAYTLELMDPYWLHEKNFIRDWMSFDPVEIAENNRHFNFLVGLTAPQITGTSTPKCLLRTRNLTEANGRSPTERSNVANVFDQHMQAFLNLWKDFDSGQEIIDALGDIFEKNPEQLFDAFGLLDLTGFDPPFLGGRHESAWYIALRRKKEKNSDPDVPPEPPNDAITTEIAVAATDVIPAVNHVIDWVKRQDRIYPVPLGVRFTDESEHFFSPEYRRPTAMLEFIIPQPETLQDNLNEVETGLGVTYPDPKRIFYQKLKFIVETTGFLEHLLDREVAKAELRKLEEELVEKFNGRPHMGKFNSVHVAADPSFLQPNVMYPEYEKWADAQSYFNRFGTFDGDFTENKTGS